jgi:hypothetical protein
MANLVINVDPDQVVGTYDVRWRLTATMPAGASKNIKKALTD